MPSRDGSGPYLPLCAGFVRRDDDNDDDGVVHAVDHAPAILEWHDKSFQSVLLPKVSPSEKKIRGTLLRSCWDMGDDDEVDRHESCCQCLVGLRQPVAWERGRILKCLEVVDDHSHAPMRIFWMAEMTRSMPLFDGLPSKNC